MPLLSVLADRCRVVGRRALFAGRVLGQRCLKSALGLYVLWRNQFVSTLSRSNASCTAPCRGRRFSSFSIIPNSVFGSSAAVRGQERESVLRPNHASSNGTSRSFTEFKWMRFAFIRS